MQPLMSLTTLTVCILYSMSRCIMVRLESTRIEPVQRCILIMPGFIARALPYMACMPQVMVQYVQPISNSTLEPTAVHSLVGDNSAGDVHVTDAGRYRWHRLRRLLFPGPLQHDQRYWSCITGTGHIL